MSQLEPCPHCHRHVMVSEPACPFCAASLADAFANLAPRATPRARLGRAAVFAFGVAASASACGDNGPPRPPDASSAQVDASTPDAVLPDADPDAGAVPIYAAAPTPDAGSPDRS